MSTTEVEIDVSSFIQTQQLPQVQWSISPHNTNILGALSTTFTRISLTPSWFWPIKKFCLQSISKSSSSIKTPKNFKNSPFCQFYGDYHHLHLHLLYFSFCIRFDISLQNYRKRSEEYLVINLAVGRKIWAIFLLWGVNLWKKQTPGGRLKVKHN